MPYTTADGRLGWKARRRELLNQMKMERGCADCGYNAHPAALQWDHRDGADKDRAASAGGRAFALGWAWERILAEIAKCDVVCANCHAVRTAERGYTGGRPMHRGSS